MALRTPLSQVAIATWLKDRIIEPQQRSLSEKQWRDVLGILKVQGVELDFDYLQQWAGKLDLVEDLTQAIGEAGLA